LNVIKRGLIYIKRHVFYTLVLTLIIAFLATVAFGAIYAYRMMSHTEENLWSGLPAVVFIEEDRIANERHWDLYGEWPAPIITRELIEEVSNLPFVQHAEISINHTLYSPNLQRYWDLELIYGDGSSLVSQGIYHIETFEVKGVNDPNFTELSHGIIQIVSGSNFTDKQLINGLPVALISQELAVANHLSVGDTIVLKDIVNRWPEDIMARYNDENIFDSQVTEFEVIGIYSLEAQLSEFEPVHIGDTILGGNEHLLEEMRMLNLIYLPLGVIEEFIDFNATTTAAFWEEETRRYFEVTLGENWQEIWEEEAGDWETFWEIDRIDRRNSLSRIDNFLILNDSRSLPNFHQAMSEILPEFIMARDVTTDGLSDVFIAMNNIRGVTLFIVFFIISAALLLLSFIMILLLRNRKSEIGIYLALGEKKRKIASQFIAESLFVTLFAITLSLPINQLLSSRISRYLTSQEMVNVQIQGPTSMMLLNDQLFLRDLNLLDWFVPKVHQLEELIELHHVDLAGTDIALFYGSATLVVTISTFVSIFYMMRLRPKDILINE